MDVLDHAERRLRGDWPMNPYWILPITENMFTEQ